MDNASASSGDIASLGDALSKLLVPSPLTKVVAQAAKSGTGESPTTWLIHVKLAENNPNLLALARFLWEQAMNYALSRRRRAALREQISKLPPGDVSALAAPVNAVRDAFLEFNEKYPHRSSEVGEVLAYCIALHHLEAAQVAAKMSLKTNANMPVHGLDGIHAKVEGDSMVVYFLESKLSQSANDGAKEYAGSIADFLTGTKQYLMEYSIVGDLGNLDTLQGAEREVALRFFDVMGHPDAPRKERSVGVICYAENLFGKLPAVADGQAAGFHEKYFSEAYAKLLAHHQAVAGKHLADKKVDPNKCVVFFVAVSDTERLRELFYEQMGVKKGAQ